MIKYYLTKNAGTYGLIYDMSATRLMDMEDIKQHVTDMSGNPDTITFKYRTYDDRIGFHTWSVLADLPDYKQQHMLWIYSNSNEHPHINHVSE